jgi:hypothetical protein
LCVVLAVWCASSDANAGVIVATDVAIGGMSPSQAPAVPEPAKPLVRDVGQLSLLYGTNHTNGAGSPAPTSGPGSGLVALASETLATTPNTLISRLALFSRISLPPPLEDRFFRPPRV